MVEIQPIWKICSSNWIISPRIGVKTKKYLIPPPRPQIEPFFPKFQKNPDPPPPRLPEDWWSENRIPWGVWSLLKCCRVSLPTNSTLDPWPCWYPRWVDLPMCYSLACWRWNTNNSWWKFTHFLGYIVSEENFRKHPYLSEKVQVLFIFQSETYQV